MEPKVIEDLFNRAVSQGYGKSIDDFKLLLSSNEEVLTDNFNYLKANGYPEERTIEDFSILVGVKKKDETEVSQSVSPLVQEGAESVQPGVQPQEKESGSSDLPIANAYGQYVSTLNSDQKLQLSGGRPMSDMALENMLRDEDSFPTQSLNDFAAAARENIIVDMELGPSSEIVPKAEATAKIPGEIGAIINEKGILPNFLVDQINSSYYWLGEAYGFLQNVDQKIDDFTRIYPSIRSAKQQKEMMSASFDLMFQGEDATDKILERFIEVTNNGQNMPDQDALIAARNTYDENGGGIWGMLVSMAKHPGATIQNFMTSQLAMLNPYSAAAFSTVEALAFTTGAAATSATGGGTVAGGLGTASRALPYAYGLSSSMLELGLSFNDFMMEELDGKEFNVENVRAVLQDPEAMDRVALKTSVRTGIVLGTDFLGSKLLGNWGSKYYNRTGSKYRLRAGIMTGDIATGITGEATAQLATKGEIDTYEALSEGFTTLGKTPFQLAANKAGITKPSYTVNGESIAQKTLFQQVKEVKTLEELEALNIKVEGDPQLSNFINIKTTELEIQGDLPENISEIDKREVLRLEVKRKKFEGRPTVLAATQIKAIDAKLKKIAEKYIDPSVVQETDTVQDQTDIQQTDTTQEQAEVEQTDETTTQQPEPADPIDPIRAQEVERDQTEKILAEQRRKGIKKDGVYTGGTAFTNSKFVEFLDSSKRYLTMARGNMPKSAYDANQKRQGAINAVAFRMKKTFNKYEKLIKKETKRGVSEENLFEIFNIILEGNKLPKDLQGVSPKAESLARKFRNEIDSYSNQILESGLVTPETGVIAGVVADGDGVRIQIEGKDKKGNPIEIYRKGKVSDYTVGESIDHGLYHDIKNNLGQYVTRAYAQFEGKNWKDTVEQQTVNTAINYLMNEMRDGSVHKAEMARNEEMGVKKTSEEVLRDLAANKVEELLNSEEGKGWYSTGKTGAMDKSKLKRKKDLPLELRALLGEITDPFERFSLTVVNQASLLHNLTFQQTIKEAGMGVWLYEANDNTRPTGFTTQIASAGSESYDILGGLQTTEEIAESLNAYKIQGNTNSWYNRYRKLIGLAKWSNTVGDFRVHVRNFEGNVSFVLANGHTDITKFGGAIKVLANDLLNLDNDQLNAKLEEYIRIGLINGDTGLGEIKSLLQAGTKDNYVDGVFRNDKNKGFIQSLADPANDLYGATDNLFKVFAYEQEMVRMSKALFGVELSELSPQQETELKDYVSNLVRDVYPTYDRISKAAQDFAAFPATATFVAFQAEQIRVAYNILHRCATELTSGNPELQAIGAKRLAGISTYVGLKGAAKAAFGMGGVGTLASLPSYLLGGGKVSEEDERFRKDVSNFVAPWVDINQATMNVEMVNGKPTLKVQDFGSADGLGQVQSVFEKLIGEIITTDENGNLAVGDPMDAFLASLEQSASPFMGEDIVGKIILDIRGELKSGQGKLINSELSFGENSAAVLNKFIQTFTPGTLERTKNELMNWFEVNSVYGFTKGTKDFGTMFEILSGATEYEQPLEDALKYRARDTFKRLVTLDMVRLHASQKDKGIVDFLFFKQKKYKEIADEMHMYYNAILNLKTKDGQGLSAEEAADIVMKQIGYNIRSNKRREDFRQQMITGEYKDFTFTESESEKIFNATK